MLQVETTKEERVTQKTMSLSEAVRQSQLWKTDTPHYSPGAEDNKRSLAMVDLYFEVVGLEQRGKFGFWNRTLRKGRWRHVLQNEDKGKSLFKSTENQENLS